jgi:putative oxidoreductase
MSASPVVQAGEDSMPQKIVRLGVHVVRLTAPASFTQLVLRIALSVPFWKSGMLKWAAFLRLNDTAIYLFTSEFKLHLPGGPYPYPAPSAMAFLSGCAEVVFPALLALGLGTRFAATGLLFMTCIVELTVPDGWPIHITWAAMALALMSWGPGRLSVDHVLDLMFRPREALGADIGEPISRSHSYQRR